MLSTIRDFFERNIAGAPAQDVHSIELATAALLLEVMRIDAGTTAAERDAVQRAIRAKFGLAEAETDALIALAEEEMPARPPTTTSSPRSSTSASARRRRSACSN